MRITNNVVTIPFKDTSGAWPERLRHTFIAAVACLLSLAWQPAASQLKLEPLKRVPPLPPSKVKNFSGGRTKADKLTLPFWDDFSFTPVNDPNNPVANLPIDTLWEDSANVYVNSGIGIKPPTLNVATFDGLDSNGLPYSNEVLANGFRDTLASRPIDLNAVPLADRATVYLSFFYQWQGNGEAPDPSDYLRVEFKNADGGWETVMTINTKASFDRTVFYDTIVQVNGERFFHDDFQFRFRNYGRLSGPFDTWNIDYVYLNKGRSIADDAFPDQAVSTPLTTLFGNYHAIPYLHFIAKQKEMSAPQYRVTNLLDDFTVLTYLTEGLFVHYHNGVPSTTFVSNLGGTDTTGINDDGSGNIPPKGERIVTLKHLPNAAIFDETADSVNVNLKVRLFTGDVINPKTGNWADDYLPIYRPLEFRLNDSTEADYDLAKHYAYDDGTAEYAVVMADPGDRGAYLFEMATPDPDTLVAIEVYSPDYGLASSITADFFIYSDDNGAPGEVLYPIPNRAIVRNSNKFQRLRIEPILVQGRFYIGWEAPVGGFLRIGLDLSNDTSDKIFIDTNGTWRQSTGIAGSLMLRPRFGGGDIVTGLPEERTPLVIYPNPNAGEFYISEKVDALEILSVTGQSVPFRAEVLEDRHRVSMTGSAPGMYILKVWKGDSLSTHKIVIR
jgi:hypothetical protein